MRFLALGTLMLSTSTGQSTIGGRAEQVVLAVLLLHPDLTVSTERLIGAMWPESPPKSARTQIAISVSKLRRRFEATGLDGRILLTDRHGYRLPLADDDLDIQVFAARAAHGRRLAADGRIEEAGAMFRDALGLWRGRPFDGLDVPVLCQAADHLTEERLTVVEQCTTAELELGLHHQLIGELRPLVAEHPQREGLAAQLMIALYRDGRQAEALAVFRRVRRDLVEELGVEPGEQLRTVHQAILAHEPSLASPGQPGRPASPAVRMIPRQLPTNIADFTGRDRELAALYAGAGTAPGVVPVTVITGAGGTGKTTLAVHAAHRLLADHPDGQLYANLQGGGTTPADPMDVLEEFLRALGCQGPEIPGTLAARSSRLRSLTADRKLLMVLDNAADEDQVTPLVPGTASCTVIVTSRVRLAGLPGAKLLELEALPADAAVTLLSRIIGPNRTTLERAATTELVALCDGLPLALRVAGSRLVARPWWRVADLVRRLADERIRLDELTYGTMAVRASVALSYAGLGHQAKRLFHRLGWLDVPYTGAWVSAALVDVELHTAEEILAGLVDANLLRVSVSSVTGIPRYDFHDLVRAFAREMAVTNESATHLRAAAERAFGCWLYLSEQAHRYESGGDYTLLHGTALRHELEPQVLAPIVAAPLVWLADERSSLLAAIRRAAEEGFDELCWNLALTAVTLYERYCHLDDWQQSHEYALAAVHATGNRRGLAAVQYSLGALYVVQHRGQDARRLLNPTLELFEGLGDTHGQGLVLRHLAFLDRSQGEFSAATTRYLRSRRLLHECGDLLGEAHVLNGLAQISIELGDLNNAIALLNDALRISSEIGSQRAVSQTLYMLGELHLHRCSPDQAELSFNAALAMVTDANDLIGQAYARLGLGVSLARQGRSAEAVQHLERSLWLAWQTDEKLIEARAHLALGCEHRQHGRPEQAGTHLNQAVLLFERLKASHWITRVRAEIASLDVVVP